MNQRKPRESVIVAHGLRMPPRLSTLLLRRRLEGAGFTPIVFSYPSVGAGLEENAARLENFARRVEREHDEWPDRRLHFVGHSLGGILIMRMLAHYRPEGLGRVVCLGSPLAACRSGAAFLRHRWGRALVGHSIADLVEAGGIGVWREASGIAVIAGDRPRSFGPLMGLAAPNDGMVLVEETRLPGVAALRVLHVTHSGLLWSRAVARETACFLSSGRFSDQSSAELEERVR